VARATVETEMGVAVPAMVVGSRAVGAVVMVKAAVARVEEREEADLVAAETAAAMVGGSSAAATAEAGKVAAAAALAEAAHTAQSHLQTVDCGRCSLLSTT
jgi:hypothetical protein